MPFAPQSPHHPPISEQWQINKFLWCCLLFLVIFIPLSSAQGWIKVPLGTAFAILGIAVINGILRTYFGWRSGGSNGPLGWVFTTVDMGLISVAVRVTFDINSELWLFYFVLLIAESMFATGPQTVVLMAMVTVGYLAGTWPAHVRPEYPLIVGTRLFFLGIGVLFARRMTFNREIRSQELFRLREQVAASDERARIAREIHDTLGRAVVSTILRLELCRRLIHKNPAEAEKLLEEEVPAIRAAWNEGRDLAFHLRPWESDPSGFDHTLQRHIGRFAERTGITVDLNLDEGEWNLAPDTEMAITRILQEALTNVAKHSQATRVEISLSAGNGMIDGSVKDDGVGFDPDQLRGNFGLVAMRERAEKLGGSLDVHSTPEKGTEVSLHLPKR
jgi:signal transduction histidine kinase